MWHVESTISLGISNCTLVLCLCLDYNLLATTTKILLDLTRRTHVHATPYSFATTSW
jgi:hypothetical protein